MPNKGESLKVSAKEKDVRTSNIIAAKGKYLKGSLMSSYLFDSNF